MTINTDISLINLNDSLGVCSDTPKKAPECDNHKNTSSDGAISLVTPTLLKDKKPITGTKSSLVNKQIYKARSKPLPPAISTLTPVSYSDKRDQGPLITQKNQYIKGSLELPLHEISNLAGLLEQEYPCDFIELLTTAENRGVKVADQFDIIGFANTHLESNPNLSLEAIGLYLSTGGTVHFLFNYPSLIDSFFKKGNKAILYKALYVLAKDKHFPDLSIPDYITKYDLNDQEMIFEIAKEAIIHSSQFCKVIAKFPIECEAKRAELAGIAISHYKRSALNNKFCENFNLSDMNFKIDLALQAASYGHPYLAINACQIVDKNDKKRIFSVGFDADPSGTWKYIATDSIFTENERLTFFQQFLKNPRTTLLEAKEFIDKISPENFSKNFIFFQEALSKASAEEISANGDIDFLDSFKIPFDIDHFIDKFDHGYNEEQLSCLREINPDMNEYVVAKEFIWINALIAKSLKAKNANNSLSWLQKESLLNKALKLRSPRLKCFIMNDLISIAENSDARLIYKKMKGKAFAKLPRMHIALLQQQGVSGKTCFAAYKAIQQTKSNGKLLFKDFDSMKPLLRVLHLLVNENTLNAGEKEKILNIIFQSNMDVTEIHSRLQLIRVVLVNDPQAFIEIDTLQDIQKKIESLFKKITAMSPQDNFSERYLKTFGSFRNPNAILVWCSGLQQLDDQFLMEDVSEFVDSVLDGTFHKKRYAAEDVNLKYHLYTVFNSLPDETVLNWKKGKEQQINSDQIENYERYVKYKDYSLVDTDDPCDILLSGTEVQGSCQNVRDDPHLNKALIAALKDGKIRMLALKDKNGKIIARSLLRLLWDSINNTPVLFMEKIYPKKAGALEVELLDQFAIARAQELGLQLLTKNDHLIDSYPSEIYQGTVESLSGELYEYVDAAGGMQVDGVYDIDDASMINIPTYDGCS